MVATSPMSFDGLSSQAENTFMRFPAETFGEFLKSAREKALVTQDKFWLDVNEIIDEMNEDLQKNKKIPKLSERTYANLERDERYPGFEELEPIYRALSQCLSESFSRSEREHYVTLAQTRIAQRRKRPKKGYMPIAADWPALLARLTAFDTRRASEHSSQKGKVPYLLAVPSLEGTPQIRLSTKVVSLLQFDTSYVVERESYIEEMMRLWSKESKRLLVTKAIAGTGKTRAFYLLLKRIARMQNHWPFYYLLSSSSQTPDDHLDNLLSLISADLQLSAEDEHLSREKRMEQIFTEIARYSKQGIHLAILIDDAHLLLSSGTISASWQHFFELWIAHEHDAVLCLATREWPRWKGRDRSFIQELNLGPLSPAAGAEIWKRFGFGDVSVELREAASRKCGGYPQWIELRASDLDEPGHHFLWPRNNKADYTSQSADNQHTKRIKRWLERETIFDPFTDVGAREELTQVFTRELPYEAQQMLDLLVLAPLGIPLPLLQQEFNHPALALDDLKRCSLVDRDSFEQGRVALVSLAREARLHQLSKEQKEQIGQQVTGLYTAWLYSPQQQQQDNAEQAELITELAILYLKRQRLLDAAELVIEHGWLLHALGYARRIARIAAEFDRPFQQSAENEAGYLLLQLRLARYYRDWTTSQSKQAYSQLYEMLSQDRIQFKSRTTLYIIHHKLRSLVRQKHYSDAHILVNVEYSRLEDLQESDPTTYIELLDHRAYVAGRWGDYLAANGELERALQLRQEAVHVHLQCLEQFRRYEYAAPDLLKNHILYQKARILHDLSFYEKVVGDEKAAIAHLEECLSLKEAGYSTQGSLALTYDDYASLMVPRGSYQKALFYTERALQLTQQYMVEAKLDGALPQKGLLLINRGKLLLQLKRFDEARQHFEEGKTLVEGTSRHDLSFPAAEWGLRSIEEQRRINPQAHLDHAWFARYKELAAYSDVKWLTTSGPLSKDELHSCSSLMKQEGQAASHRLSEIIMQSQKRELAASFEEQREPHFQYLVPQDEIAKKLAGFARLRQEVETEEANVIVRHLYLDTIDERIHELEMIAAAGRQDNEAFWIQTRHLYALPDLHEMELSLLPLAQDLRKGLQNSSTSDLAMYILHQTQNWSIDPMSLLGNLEQELEQAIEAQGIPQVVPPHKLISSEVAQRFFEDVFRRYQFTWTVVRDPFASHERVSLNEKQLILPKDEPISNTKIREILAHEIEGHAFRSVAGEKSRLQLLSLGLADFLKTEEGLATYYSQEAARFGTAQPNKSWIGTLTIGLAAGIICPPFSFNMLRSFLIKVFRLRSLLANGKKTTAQIDEEALKNAHRRCLRTFRGVPILTQPGVCATKDSAYLRGYLAVREKLHQEPETFERLLAGSVGLQHLDTLAELGITKPHVSFQRLACDPNLESYITQFSQGKYSYLEY